MTNLRKLLEYRVQIIGNNGYTDTGILENCDETWIKLRKENDEVLYFTVCEVRLVKVLS